MTAHHDTGQMRSTVEGLNLAGFIGKPFTMPDLLKVVQRVVKQTDSAADANITNTSLPKVAVQEQLQTLRRQTGAHTVMLVRSDGSPVQVVGNADRARASRLASFVSANFLSIIELASLFGDNDSVFKSSYYEGNNYNIYAYNINGDFFLAVVFGAGGKPGTVWFYTKQTATELASALPGSKSTLSQNANTTIATDFDDLVGEAND
jgi:predicted regulator of Ras-like GTPase activity (Roadblock/LC7/MglB family)